MVLLLGLDRGTRDAAPQVSCQHKMRDSREEVDRGKDVGWRPVLQKEVQNVEEPEAG